ncbi:uncharacterized protein LOC112340867 [Selaginella moellendorffii]|uniref:uncharacterized protein LOC112340867 n=1 Tax=Selaginella moellendorffii TaxID=88036 RepID=UPI000D1CB542|nr:uncharacterized protein LOC112340867 [Selaginella moellendorffii]|eukprot:XP_024515783.1 uncharacterized protein LOC112340867 [Selaginella moellendorffii]
MALELIKNTKMVSLLLALAASILMIHVDANSRLDVYTIPGCQDPGQSYTAKPDPCTSTCVLVPINYRFTYDGQAGLFFDGPDCSGALTTVRSNVSSCDLLQASPLRSAKFSCRA